MLNLKQLDLSDDLIFLFNKYNIEDDEEIVTRLEQYCVFTRQELVAKLNVITNKNFKELYDIDIPQDLQEIALRYTVLPTSYDGEIVTIYYNGFEDIDRDGIEADLYTYDDVIFVALTPYNFHSILEDTQELDYEFLLKVLITECVRMKGTDIHITCGYIDMVPEYWVDFRIDNRIVRYNTIKFNQKINKDFILKVFARMTDANQNDIDVQGSTSNIRDPLGCGKYVIRITANPTICGYNCVMRIQKLNTVSLKINELGFDKMAVGDLNFLANKTSGLTLITGPIRSGKNTTAFALANSLMTKPIRLVDYSSPIETLMGFPQIDYREDVDNLIACIKYAKKQDVDVAFINEIPAKDVAFAVRELINSSVGVVTTMHIDRIWHIPNKLYEYFGESYKDVITQINAVCNQKMLVKQCQKCAEVKHIETLNPILRDFLASQSVHSYYLNKGCPDCLEGSIPGAVQPYVEILIFTEEIKQGLLKCNYPYEMVTYIYNKMHERKASLEYKISEAVRLGNVVVDSLYSII